MTTIALNYSQNLLNRFWRVFKNILQGIMFGYIMARQNQINHRIAHQMIHEFRRGGHTVESLHAELNQRSIERLKKEFCRD